MSEQLSGAELLEPRAKKNYSTDGSDADKHLFPKPSPFLRNGDTDIYIRSASSSSERPSRMSTEKWLVFLLLAIVAVLLIIIIVLAVRNDGSQNARICLTPHCVETAARVMDSMDTSVDPCDNFYLYSCGSWISQHMIPDERSTYNTFSKLMDEINLKLKGLLEEKILPQEPRAISQSKVLFQSCLNTSHIDTRNTDPLLQFIQELGGWPILQPNWNESHFNWIETVAKLRLYNNRVLIDQWVSPDDRNSNINVIQLDQTRLGMPSREYYLKARENTKLLAYETFARDVALLLGANHSTASNDVKELIDFEITLANITTPEDERRDQEALYKKLTIEELYTNVTDEIDWLQYFQQLYRSTNLTVTSDTHVVLYATNYMQKLAKVIKNTPKRVVANYMVWVGTLKMINQHSVPSKLARAKRNFDNVLYGTDSDEARWRTCVGYVSDTYGMAVGRLFVKHHFDEEAKEKAMMMIADIDEAFSELLNHVTWMDDATKDKARIKAKHIHEQIGYPEYIMDDKTLNDMYDGIVVQSDTFFENVLSALRDGTMKNLMQLNETVDKEKWSTTPSTVNAFYSASKNQIIFPAAILQPPFYNKHYPKSMNYGAIGMVIGHEITHGFDDRGRQFDKAGNLQQWWSDSVIEAFKNQTQCIIQQYGNYTVPEINMKLNGKQTQGENIADNGGLKQAFYAYKQWVKHNGPEALLPGLDLTHEQLFFLSFAQVWCGLSRPESYERSIHTGNHSPGMFRVQGSVSNSFDFAAAYNCKPGSKMNPVDKCSVW